jgi:hypothetical protein
MKLRAQIVIEVEALDFVSAANHEQNIQAIFKSLKKDYDGAQLEFREVRSKALKSGGAPLQKMRRYTGSLHEYVD